MALDALAARTRAFHDVLAKRGRASPALTALARFLDQFADQRAAAFFAAAEATIDGEPLPERETAVMAAAAAVELDAVIELMSAWRAPKAAITTAQRLAAFFRENPSWSLGSIALLVGEALKRRPAPDAA